MKSRKLRTEQGLWNTSNIVDLRETLRSHLSLYHLRNTNLVPSGYHQVSFNKLAKEFELCEDGADRSHAPSADWKYRVWAGGYMEFQNPFVYVDNPKYVVVNERISDTRVTGDPNGEDAKVFVTLTRNLIKAQTDAEGNPILKSDRYYIPTQEQRALIIKEEKYLCFMKQIPPGLQSSATPRRLRPPGAPTYSQSMTPTATLLFRFSGLTHNAHAIHLDPDFSRVTYGLPNLLVHGPLTSVLMLDILNEALELQTVGMEYGLAVRSFNYKNLLPLFVGDRITIACRKIHNVPDRHGKFISHFARPWEKWDVWIQKGEGENTTMAVKGEAWVSPTRLGGGRAGAPAERARDDGDEDE